MYVLIKSIYIYNQFLLKSSYTERKQVSWFLIFFEMFSESFVIKYKVKICDCYTFVCLKYKGKFCDSYTAENHLVKILRQNLWLLHQSRDSFVWMFESCILPFLISKLNFWTKSFVLWIVVGSKKLSGNMWMTIFMG